MRDTAERRRSPTSKKSSSCRPETSVVLKTVLEVEIVEEGH